MAKKVEIKKLNIQIAKVPVVGETELIMHRWDQKTKEMILAKQMGETVIKRKKDPQADYEATMYRLDDGGYGFPAAGFKGAIVGGCRMFDGLHMTVAKVNLFVNGEMNSHGENLIRINAEPHMREDMVRLETKVADIRYRAGFWPWSAVLEIQFNADIITPDNLVNLVNAAGMSGVGEWRPSAPKSSTGEFGRFRLDTSRDISIVDAY